MRKVSNSYPTGIQLENDKKVIENNTVSNVSYQNKEIGWGVGNTQNRYPQATIGWGSDTLDTRPRETLPAKAGFVGLNESGTQRIGEYHARAKLTDAEVETIRDEYEAHPPGVAGHIGYKLLARRWGVSKRTIRDIVNYEKRNQWAERWKKVT